VREGWQRKKLGEVCTIDKAQGIHRDLPYIGLEHIESNTARFIGTPEPQSVKSTTFRFTQEHVLYGRLRPYLNKALLPSFVGHCSTEIYPLKPGRELTREYLLRWLLAESTCMLINKTCRGARMPRAKMGELMKFEIPVPPLQEQRRIIKLVDEVFAGIAKAKESAEKNLQKSNALFESHLQSVFTERGKGWVNMRLSELAKISYGYTESSSVEKIGPHFLRITDIQDNRVDWPAVPYCRIDNTDFPKYRLKDGDIVFARTGATTGKSYLVNDPPSAVFASYLIRVQLIDKTVLPRFLNLYFQTQSYWNIIRKGVSGSAQGGFNATKLGGLLIPFPRIIKDQEGIIEKLEALSAQTQKLYHIYKQKQAALETLKKSILHEAFSGNL